MRKPVFFLFSFAITCRCLSAGALDYGPPRQLCVYANKEVDESSGLAVSATRDGVFYTHNDDDGDNRLFAFSAEGKSLGVYLLKNTKPQDWEDLATLTVDSKHYIVCAAVGDNSKKRKFLTLYVIPEPAGNEPTMELPVMAKIDFVFEDGPHNCEAVGVDPTSNTLLLITKEKDESNTLVYALDPNVAPAAGELLRARRIGRLNLKKRVTSMDIAPDGSRAAFLAEDEIYEIPHAKGETWAQSIGKGPKRIATLPKGQWEALCYGKDGRTLYATREGHPTPLFVIPPKRPQ